MHGEALQGRTIDIATGQYTSNVADETAWSNTTPYSEASPVVAYAGRRWQSAAGDVRPIYGINTTTDAIYAGDTATLDLNSVVVFAGAGTMPGGVTVNTPYYVVEKLTDVSGFAYFCISATPGGAKVNLTSPHAGDVSIVLHANIGNIPSADSIYWIDAGPTNRHAMFDEASLTQTVNSSSISVQVTPGSPFDMVALLNITGISAVAIAASYTGASHHNYLRVSEQFQSATWTKTRATITADADLAPNGTLTADKLVEDATAANTHQVSQAAATNPAGASMVATSVHAWPGERKWLAITTTNSAAVTRTSYFDVDRGVVGSVGAGHTALIVEQHDGSYRCIVLTAQGASTGTFTVAFGLAADDGQAVYTGNGSSGLYIWGAQCEQAAAASTYIQTAASAVTTATHTFYDRRYDLVDTSMPAAWPGILTETRYKYALGVSDLPPHPGVTITLTLSGPGTVGCGKVLFGLSTPIGSPEIDAADGIERYSGINRSPFGKIDVVRRGYSDRGDFTIMLPIARSAAIKRLMTETGDVPSMYFMRPAHDEPGGWDPSTIYHAIAPSFERRLKYHTHHVYDLELMGMT